MILNAIIVSSWAIAYLNRISWDFFWVSKRITHSDMYNMNFFYEEISYAFPVLCLSGRVPEDVFVFGGGGVYIVVCMRLARANKK